MIQNLYWNQKAFIRTEEGLSPEINIRRGVRQGCVLSPALFNLYTENIFRHINNDKGVRIGGRVVNNLRYADDTVLLAETEQELQEILNDVNNNGKLYGMKMNAKKTKSMLITRNNSNNIKLRIDDADVQQVKSFIYLGQIITDDGKCDTEIVRRIGIAKSAFNTMANTLTSRNISLKTRKRIVKCYIWSSLLYGSETWTLSPTSLRKLQAFEMWVYRKMFKISWTQKITNENVLKMAQTNVYIVPAVKKRKLIYFGHMVRRDNLQRLLLEGKVEGKRSRGRPRIEWMDNILEWSSTPQYDEVIRKAQDRNVWRIITANLPGEDGTL